MRKEAEYPNFSTFELPVVRVHPQGFTATGYQLQKCKVCCDCSVYRDHDPILLKDTN